MKEYTNRAPVQVVAGVIWNDERNALLISRRPLHLHKGGYWEFPGGKIEPGEAGVEALARELQEELDIGFSKAVEFHVIEYDYPEKRVRLVFYHVYGVQGVVSGRQSQEWRWVPLAELSGYSFPEANRPVVDALLEAV